jgi:2'-5' RNA ligase
MVRAFVAFEVSDGMRTGFAAAQDVLRGCSARLTFVDPRLIHVTVKFLGEVDEKKIPQVMAALKTVKAAPFTVDGITITVNSRRNPRTVWCAMDDHGKGREVFAAVENVLAPLGFARETRDYLSHATLARVREADPSLFSALDKLKDFPCGSCTVAGIKLKKSTLTRAGPVYEDLMEAAWQA